MIWLDYLRCSLCKTVQIISVHPVVLLEVLVSWKFQTIGSTESWKGWRIRVLMCIQNIKCICVGCCKSEYGLVIHAFNYMPVVWVAFLSSFLENILKSKNLFIFQQQRRLDLLTITHPDNLDPDEQQRIVFISARVHPGETPSSYVCQGRSKAS